MTTPVTNTGSPITVIGANEKTGFAKLGQGDFLKMMTTQLQQQDPFNPMDQTQMLAQMAQFSSLAGITESNETLKTMADKLSGVADKLTGISESNATLASIAEKLDAILAAQEAAAKAASAQASVPAAETVATPAT